MKTAGKLAPGRLDLAKEIILRIGKKYSFHDHGESSLHFSCMSAIIDLVQFFIETMGGG